MTRKRLAVVVNPRGGTRRGLAIWQQVKPVFDAANVELDVRVTEYAGHAREIARTLDQDCYDGVCAVGGDGTIHEVVNGLLQHACPSPMPLGIIPAGSGNTMHQHLKCTDALEAARRIVAGRTCPIDAARLVMDDATVYCVDIVGWGVVADIAHTAERLRLLGPRRYEVATLWHILRARRRRAKVILDGQAIEDAFLFVLACNAKYTGKGMMLAPRAELDDGLIDVVMVRRASRREMVELFSKIFTGAHLGMPCVEYRQVRSFAIESEGCDPLDIDGELIGHAPFQAELLPAALRLFA